MKKFKFSLQTVFEYKQTVEKQQKADLKRAEEALRLLREEEARLEQAFQDNVRSLERALAENRYIVEALERHDAYFRFLRDARAVLMEKIEAAEEEKIRCQALLITTMKEIKTFEKLRDEQFKKFLEEMRREEAKDMGDIVSFQTITKELG